MKILGMPIYYIVIALIVGVSIAVWSSFQPSSSNVQPVIEPVSTPAPVYVYVIETPSYEPKIIRNGNTYILVRNGCDPNDYTGTNSCERFGFSGEMSIEEVRKMMGM